MKRILVTDSEARALKTAAIGIKVLRTMHGAAADGTFPHFGADGTITGTAEDTADELFRLVERCEDVGLGFYTLPEEED